MVLTIDEEKLRKLMVTMQNQAGLSEYHNGFFNGIKWLKEKQLQPMEATSGAETIGSLCGILTS